MLMFTHFFKTAFFQFKTWCQKGWFTFSTQVQQFLMYGFWANKTENTFNFLYIVQPGKSFIPTVLKFEGSAWCYLSRNEFAVRLVWIDIQWTFTLRCSCVRLIIIGFAGFLTPVNCSNIELVNLFALSTSVIVTAASMSSFRFFLQVPRLDHRHRRHIIRLF